MLRGRAIVNIMKPDWGSGVVGAVLKKDGGSSESVSVHQCPGRENHQAGRQDHSFQKRGCFIRALHGKNIS